MKNEKKLIIFDLDDVLLNTTFFVNKMRKVAVKAMMEKGLKGNPAEILNKWYEKIARLDSNKPDQLNVLCELYGFKDNPEIFSTENNRLVAAGRLAYHGEKLKLLKPDIKINNFLKELKIKYTIAIVTRGLVERQWEKIYLTNLDKIVGNENIFVISYDDKRRKTDIYNFIIRKYGTRPESGYIVDDRSSGITDANDAGLNSILYLNKKGNYYERALDDLKNGKIRPKFKIKDLKEIVKIVE
jgi:FMN phosphatase YigB (HAD superfamily)